MPDSSVGAGGEVYIFLEVSGNSWFYDAKMKVIQVLSFFLVFCTKAVRYALIPVGRSRPCSPPGVTTWQQTWVPWLERFCIAKFWYWGK